MAKFILAVSLLMIYGCVNNQKQAVEPKVRKANFDYFEISYRGGWIGNLSFRVDSNKIYLSSDGHRVVKYGILPDSIYNSINTIVYSIQPDTIIKLHDDNCTDCSSLAINVKIEQDTIQVFQHRVISNSFVTIVRQLNSFISNSKHNYVNAYMYLPTLDKVLPPPKIDMTKFVPPSTKKKGK